MKRVILLLGVFLAPQVASSAVTFDQIGDNVFVVSHFVKVWGGRGQATALVIEKAASLCVAAGYSHMLMLNEQSSAGGDYEYANAQVRVAFRMSGGEELLECKRTASEKYVKQAKNELDRIGYSGPVEPEPAVAGGGSGASGACSLDQIMTMTNSGFTEAQIRAACPNAP